LIVCRADRPVEVRLDPRLAYGLIGGGEAAQAIARPWAARGWVNHVRPVFILAARSKRSPRIFNSGWPRWVRRRRGRPELRKT
jgi:hypothetical protein